MALLSSGRLPLGRFTPGLGRHLLSRGLFIRGSPLPAIPSDPAEGGMPVLNIYILDGKLVIEYDDGT